MKLVNTRTSLVALAAIAVMLTAPAFAAPCSTCRGKGEIEIKRDSSYKRAAETQAELGLWCNWCDAIGLYDEEKVTTSCPNCTALTGPDDAPSWAKEALQYPLSHWWGSHDHSQVIFMVSPRFTLSSSLEQLELKKHARSFGAQRKDIAKQCPGKGVGKGAVMSRHERAHLWMIRLNEAYKFICESCGIDEKKDSELVQHSYLFNAMLWGDGSEYSQFWQDQGMLFRRGPGNTLCWNAGKGVADDDFAWARALRNMGQIWVERAYPNDPKKGLQGWLVHGMAHLVEMRFLGEIRHSLGTEVSSSWAWGGPKNFRNHLYKKVTKKKINLQEVLTTQWEAMGLQEQMASWSLIEYLSADSTKKFRKLLDGLIVRQESLSDALRESHGWTLGMLEANWFEFVVRHYKADERAHPPWRGK